MRPSFAIVVGTLAALASCNTVVTTLPPPTASLSTAPCMASGCPADGVVVIIRGTARAGALVLAENVSRPYRDGRSYVGSATATRERDADGGVATAGQFEIILGAIPQDGEAPPHVSRRRDRVRVWQYVDGPTQLEGSLPAERELTVP